MVSKTIFLLVILSPWRCRSQKVGDTIPCVIHGDCYTSSPPYPVYLAQKSDTAKFGPYGCQCIRGMCKIELGIGSEEMALDCLHCGSKTECRSLAIYRQLEQENGRNIQTLITDKPDEHTDPVVPPQTDFQTQSPNGAAETDIPEVQTTDFKLGTDNTQLTTAEIGGESPAPSAIVTEAGSISSTIISGSETNVPVETTNGNVEEPLTEPQLETTLGDQELTTPGIPYTDNPFKPTTSQSGVEHTDNFGNTEGPNLETTAATGVEATEGLGNTEGPNLETTAATGVEATEGLGNTDDKSLGIPTTAAIDAEATDGVGMTDDHMPATAMNDVEPTEANSFGETGLPLQTVQSTEGNLPESTTAGFFGGTTVG